MVELLSKVSFVNFEQLAQGSTAGLQQVWLTFKMIMNTDKPRLNHRYHNYTKCVASRDSVKLAALNVNATKGTNNTTRLYERLAPPTHRNVDIRDGRFTFIHLFITVITNEASKVRRTKEAVSGKQNVTQ